MCDEVVVNRLEVKLNRLSDVRRRFLFGESCRDAPGQGGNVDGEAALLAWLRDDLEVRGLLSALHPAAWRRVRSCGPKARLEGHRGCQAPLPIGSHPGLRGVPNGLFREGKALVDLFLKEDSIHEGFGAFAVSAGLDL